MQLQDMDLSARYYYNTKHTSSTTKQQLAAHTYTHSHVLLTSLKPSNRFIREFLQPINQKTQCK